MGWQRRPSRDPGACEPLPHQPAAPPLALLHPGSLWRGLVAHPARRGSGDTRGTHGPRWEPAPLLLGAPGRRAPLVLRDATDPAVGLRPRQGVGHPMPPCGLRRGGYRPGARGAPVCVGPWGPQRRSHAVTAGHLAMGHARARPRAAGRARAAGPTPGAPGTRGRWARQGWAPRQRVGGPDACSGGVSDRRRQVQAGPRGHGRSGGLGRCAREPRATAGGRAGAVMCTNVRQGAPL